MLTHFGTLEGRASIFRAESRIIMKLIALLLTPLISTLSTSSESECECLRNLNEESGDNNDGFFPSHTAKKKVGHNPEEMSARLQITDGDDGECYVPTDGCTHEEDPCNWTYSITVSITNDPGKDNIVEVVHRGGVHVPDAFGQITIAGEELARDCGEPKVLHVRSRNSSGDVMSDATLETLECINCDKA